LALAMRTAMTIFGIILKLKKLIKKL